jgi:membrane protein YqaA with SNARE-associated domain
MGYVLVTLVVFAINLLPAFGPPTWAVLVFVRLNWHLNPVLVVLLGCGAAVAGRYLLATGARRFQHVLPHRYVDNLSGARSLIARKKIGVIALMGVFLISPLPSAQLFVAAGLLELPIRTVSVAFFAGRLVTYSLYIGAATLATKQFGAVVGNIFGSPWSIALQLVLVALVCALPLVDWRRLAHHSRNEGDTVT